MLIDLTILVTVNKYIKKIFYYYKLLENLGQK